MSDKNLRWNYANFCEAAANELSNRKGCSVTTNNFPLEAGYFVKIGLLS